MQIIEFSKSLICRETIVKFLTLFKDFSFQDQKDTWQIIPNKKNTIEEIETVREKIYELEYTSSIENKIAPIREILYKKAFAPIYNDKTTSN
ncbi:MAG: hypothetical protein ACPKNR_03480 [Pleomorphochaeta sp.]